jgi:hypothetical protein
MSYLLFLGALGASWLLLYSMWLDEKKHKDCDCPIEDDPSFVWYPVRWVLIAIMILVFFANLSYSNEPDIQDRLHVYVDFLIVALAWMYGFTLINSNWSLTIVIEKIIKRFKNRKYV